MTTMKLHPLSAASAACALLLSFCASAAIAQSDAADADEQRAAEASDRARQAEQRAKEAGERAQAQANRAVLVAQAGEHARFMAEDMAFAAREMGQERVVKGAPYCADATHETIQPLADGNRIYRKQVSRLCRDGEGRTRQEVEHNGKRSIYLNDPVAKENWVLDPDTKTARNLRIAIHTNFSFGDGASWSGLGERVREITRRIGSESGTPPRAPAAPAPLAQPAPPVPPAPALIKETESTDDKGRVQRNVEVRVIRLNDGEKVVTTTTPVPPVPPMPPTVAMPAIPANVQLRALTLAPRGPGVLSSLGAKEIEGVKVNGERTTWTIEAGKQGNEKPMVTTREVWTSPDLLLTVSSRDFDPRTGEVTYKLGNIRRGEPDASLFKVPADYEKARNTPKPTPKG